MIEATALTKRYGSKTAVDAVSFAIQPGRVTGFLGPNGAGKSTTMRMIVGLHRPTSGTVTVDGKAYRDLRAPLTEVGILLDARAYHPGRSARDHLRALAATHGIGRKHWPAWRCRPPTGNLPRGLWIGFRLERGGERRGPAATACRLRLRRRRRPAGEEDEIEAFGEPPVGVGARVEQGGGAGERGAGKWRAIGEQVHSSSREP